MSSANALVARPYAQPHHTSIVAQNQHAQGQLATARIPTEHDIYSQGHWLGTSQHPNYEQRPSMPGSATAITINSQQTQHFYSSSTGTVNKFAHSQHPATSRPRQPSTSASTDRSSPIAPQAGCFKENVAGPYRAHGTTHQSSQISSGGALPHPPVLSFGGHQNMRSSENNLQSRHPPMQEPRREVTLQAQDAPQIHANSLDRTPSTPSFQPQNQSDGVRRQSTSTFPPSSRLHSADTVSHSE